MGGAVLGAAFAVAEFGQVFGDEIEVGDVPGGGDRERREAEEAEVEQTAPPGLPRQAGEPDQPRDEDAGDEGDRHRPGEEHPPIAAPQAIAHPVLCNRSARSSA